MGITSANSVTVNQLKLPIGVPGFLEHLEGKIIYQTQILSQHCHHFYKVSSKDKAHLWKHIRQTKTSAWIPSSLVAPLPNPSISKTKDTIQNSKKASCTRLCINCKRESQYPPLIPLPVAHLSPLTASSIGMPAAARNGIERLAASVLVPLAWPMDRRQLEAQTSLAIRS